MLQTNTSVQRGVSFNLERREALETLSKQKSPVKINNYKISNKYNRKDVIINKETTVIPTSATFAYQDQEDVLSIASLTHVANEQLITIKGYMAYLSGTKKIAIHGSEVKKQYIEDFLESFTTFGNEQSSDNLEWFGNETRKLHEKR